MLHSYFSESPDFTLQWRVHVVPLSMLLVCGLNAIVFGLVLSVELSLKVGFYDQYLLLNKNMNLTSLNAFFHELYRKRHVF